MIDLSPQAQAVLDAYDISADGHYDNGVWIPHVREQLAAALRAAVDQVLPKEWPTIEDYNEYEQGVAAAHIKHRNQILAIANELESV